MSDTTPKCNECSGHGGFHFTGCSHKRSPASDTKEFEDALDEYGQQCAAVGDLKSGAWAVAPSVVRKAENERTTARSRLTALYTEARKDALPDVEAVAEFVHYQWMAAKRRQGVQSRLSETGEELMRPYSVLSEVAKDLDRVTVRAVYQAIKATAARIAGGTE